MTPLTFLLLELSPFFLFKVDFVSSSATRTLLEYFDGTYQKGRTGLLDVSRTRMTTLLFCFWRYLPLLYLTVFIHWLFPVCSVGRIPFGVFYDTWKKCRTGQDEVSRTRMTTLAVLLLELFPFVLFIKLI